MANEYASVAEIKDHLGIGDTAQDDNLAIIAESASRAVDDFCHRRFYADQSASARTFNAERRWVFVDDISTVTDLVVATDDGTGTFGTTWTIDQYSGFGFRVWPYNADDEGWPFTRLEAIGSWWPQTAHKVRVTAAWGWPAVPPAVREATILLAQSMWTPSGILVETAGTPGVQSVELAGSDSVTYAAANTTTMAAAELEKRAHGLLGRYVKRRVFI